MKPTLETYTHLQDAYDFFNRKLFNGELPDCLITYQRHKGSYGYFLSNTFVNDEKTTVDEIAMNPRYFLIRSIEEVLSTLVHEMVHLKQEHFGTPGRGRYHNKEWADMMLGIGLIPSVTGEEGGKQTGDSMSHYIEEGGRFSKACSQLINSGFKLKWKDRYVDDIQEFVEKGGDLSGVSELTGIEFGGSELDEPQKTREKFSCPSCGNNAWGKPSLNLICGDCETSFEVT